MKKQLLLSRGKVDAYILLPLIFALIPTAWIEAGPPLCLIRAVTGHKCPGCGMTRAVSCVLHGHFRQAFRYNKLVVIVFPLLVSSWLQGLTVEYKKYVMMENA